MTKLKLKSKQLSLRYLQEAMNALEILRTEAISCENMYFSRLLTTINIKSSLLPILSQKKHLCRKIFNKVSIIIYALFYLPSFIYQYRKIQCMDICKKKLVIGSASNRIVLNDRLSSPRENFVLLSQTVGSTVQNSIQKKIAETEHLYLLDPLPLSKIWKYRKACWRDSILIVDATFLFVFSFFRLMHHPFKEVFKRFNLFKQCYAFQKKEKNFNYKKFLRFYMNARFLQIFETIFPTIDAMFFNSNSTLIELLRIYCIQKETCLEVLEIMHGIGSIISEKYFLRIFQAGLKFGAYQKLYFVPQIPGMPFYGVYKLQLKLPLNLAINPYLLQYILRADMDNNLKKILISKYKNFFSNDPSLQIITIFGNCPQTHDLNISIIYVPHPMVIDSLYTYKFFQDNHIQIFSKSVFCWLISDACISLLSSAMFEAAYFGSTCFTPTIVEDKMYTKDYLNLLSYPENNKFESFIASLESFVVKCSMTRKDLISERIDSRLKLMIGSKLSHTQPEYDFNPTEVF